MSDIQAQTGGLSSESSGDMFPVSSPLTDSKSVEQSSYEVWASTELLQVNS